MKVISPLLCYSNLIDVLLMQLFLLPSSFCVSGHQSIIDTSRAPLLGPGPLSDGQFYSPPESLAGLFPPTDIRQTQTHPTRSLQLSLFQTAQSDDSDSSFPFKWAYRHKIWRYTVHFIVIIIIIIIRVFRFPALHFTPRNEWRSSFSICFTAQWKELCHLQTSYCLENNSITQLPLQWAFHTMGGPILCRHRHSPEQKQSCSR